MRAGIDPVTHRRRTDLLATLPQLMALASLGGLMDYRSLDDQLRAEAVQLANLQCLQYLLQSSAAIDGSASTIGNNPGGIASSEMDPTNLLNQPLPIMSTNLSHSPFTVDDAPTQLHSSEILCSLEQSVGNDARGSSTSIDFRQGESKRVATPMVSPPPLADASMGSGEACSSCCYGGSVTASFWPEVLFDEPLLTEFA